MSFIKYSAASRADLVRLHEFLAQYDVSIADRAIDAVIEGIDYIENHPTSGAPLSDRLNIRKSIIGFGASGYLVFHKRYEKTNTNFIARIIHQKEWYDETTIGLVEEKIADTTGSSLHG